MMENLLNLPRQPDRWYREPWLLLVFGGPLLVILACIATIYLAITHPRSGRFKRLLPRRGAH